MTDSISPSFLYHRPATNRFLYKHLSFTRRVGQSANRETDFLKRTEDSFTSSIGNKESPLTKSPLNLNKSVAEKSRFKNNMVLDMPAMGNRNKPMAGKPIMTDTNVKINFRHNYDTARFLLDNYNLVEQLSSDPELLDSLLNSPSVNKRDIEKEIVSKALDRLEFASPISRDFLEKNLDIAKVIALDIGNISDVLNKNDDLAKAMNMGGLYGEDIIRERAAQKAASMFHHRSKVTETFLRENPIAAIYLIQNPDIARELDNSNSKATDFVNTFTTLENQLKPSIVSQALSLLSGTGITQDFLENNMEFAEVIVADELANDGPSLAGYLRNRSDLTRIIGRIENGEVYMDSSGMNLSELIAAQQSKLAVEKLPSDFPLDEDFFRNNVGLAFLVNQSEEFSKALADSEELVVRFINSKKTGLSKTYAQTRTAINAFLSGFLSREDENNKIDTLA